MLERLVLSSNPMAGMNPPGIVLVDADAWLLPPDAIALEQSSGLASTTFMPESVVIAQQFDQDILGELGSAFNTFYESGQIWALIIGIVIGYLIRGMTTYS
ncbi:MAG: hypothetical protein ACTS3T_02640 [Almyronema sp.]